MKTFRVINGSHFEGKIEYVKGQTIQTESDLAKSFPNKFEEVASSPSKSPTLVTGPLKPNHTDEKKDKGLADVTSEFPLAVASDLRVHLKSAGWYVVSDPDGEQEIGGKAVRKAEVDGVINTYIEG